MSEIKTKAAVKAILEEYTKSVAGLKALTERIDTANLVAIADPFTTDTNCRSVQTVLAHVVHSGYGYAVYIRRHKNLSGERPPKLLRQNVMDYSTDLENMLQFTRDTFETIGDDELEEMDNAKKIATDWGQRYDIEQMMEHAIVHVLRHRRQIENFIYRKEGS